MLTWQQLLILHAIPTIYMTGLIWFVQVTHYPLFSMIDARSFPAYEAAHCRRTTWVVLPPMLVELGFAGWLWLATPDDSSTLAAIALAMVVAIWVSTFAVQVPCHNRLNSRLDHHIVRRLVASNWLRTALWTGRTAIAVALLWPASQ